MTNIPEKPEQKNAPTAEEIAAYERAKKIGASYPIDRAIAIENYYVLMVSNGFNTEGNVHYPTHWMPLPKMEDE